jgi:hypothetical protein
VGPRRQPSSAAAATTALLALFSCIALHGIWHLAFGIAGFCFGLCALCQICRMGDNCQNQENEMFSMSLIIMFHFNFLVFLH